MVSVVLIVHARGTDSLRALFAEVLDALVGMAVTRNDLHYRLSVLVRHIEYGQ